MAIHELIGEEIESYQIKSDQILFETSLNTFQITCSQSCEFQGNSAKIERITGDFENLVNSPILEAAKTVSYRNPPPNVKTFLRTKFRLETEKGSVDIHWLSVDCYGGINEDLRFSLNGGYHELLDVILRKSYKPYINNDGVYRYLPNVVRDERYCSFDSVLPDGRVKYCQNENDRLTATFVGFIGFKPAIWKGTSERGTCAYCENGFTLPVIDGIIYLCEGKWRTRYVKKLPGISDY